MKKYLKFIIPAICSLILFGILLWTGSQSEGKQYLYTDATSCTGFLVILFAIFLWLTTAGSVDMLIYGVNIFIRSIFNRLKDYPKTYYDYITKKNGERENNRPCLWPTFVIGLIYILISLYFYFLVEGKVA